MTGDSEEKTQQDGDGEDASAMETRHEGFNPSALYDFLATTRGHWCD